MGMAGDPGAHQSNRAGRIAVPAQRHWTKVQLTGSLCRLSLLLELTILWKGVIMRCGTKWLAAAVGVCLLGFFAGAVSAQKSTVTENKSFEVISVDGNKVVLREKRAPRRSRCPKTSGSMSAGSSCPCTS